MVMGEGICENIYEGSICMRYAKCVRREEKRERDEKDGFRFGLGGQFKSSPGDGRRGREPK